MATELSNFIRFGGQGAIVLRSMTTHGLSVKQVGPSLGVLRDRFAANLDRADLFNADTLGRLIGDAFDPPLTNDDMADLSADKTDAMEAWEARIAVVAAEWGGQPDRFDAVRLEVEDELLRAFAALANERRQAFLGITRYVWRSRDDERVRHAHAVHDDQVFDWEEPPEGGHPGMAWGCRCWAQPWVEPVEPYVPLTGQALEDAVGEAEDEGERLATRDAVREALMAIPAWLYGAERLLDLVGKEDNGTLTAAEAEELRGLRVAANARFDAAQALLADVPGAIQDVRDYRRRLLDRAEGVVSAYQAGEATEAQMRDAVRDFGYADMSIGLGVIGTAVAIALHLPSRRGASFDILDRDAMRRFWRDESGAVGPRSIGWDWPVRRNGGIQWGGPIRLQGSPWEDMLDGQEGLGDRLPRTFPTIDFYDEATQLATSAKTLNAGARSYVDQPGRIYGRLRGYLDRLASFDGDRMGGRRVRGDRIDGRRLELAIPSTTTTEQMLHVQRAIDYARSLGVEMIVTRIN